NELKVAEELFISIDDQMNLGNVYTNISRVYNYHANYKKAIESIYQAINSFEKAKIPVGEINANLNLISIYIMVKENNEALKRCEIIYPKIIASKDSSLLCSYYLMKASLFLDNEPLIAKKLYEKALRIAIKINKHESHVFLLMTIGKINTDQYKITKNISLLDSAKLQYKRARNICKVHNIGLYHSACLNSLAEIALIDKSYTDAIKYAKEALALETNSNVKINQLTAYSHLADAYSAAGDKDSALNYMRKIILLKDELGKNEIKRSMVEGEVDYNVEKNKALYKAKIAEQERDITRRNAIIIVLICVALIVFLIIAFLYVRYQRERQKAFSIMLIETQEEERKRISKELHDGIGQNLLMIKSECGNNTPLVETTIDELRAISRNLHPVQLEKLGLEEALENVVITAEKNSEILFSFEIDKVNDLLNPTQKINLYRIVQESVSNILKHSKASSARLTVYNDGKSVVTTIYDDGVGFDLSSKRKSKSLGLTSIAERVNLLKGNLIIVSGEKGTRIEIKFSHDKS
ncbi:MAG: tetratricopeptide repeat protein, partial [Bacteroidia bacterium]